MLLNTTSALRTIVRVKENSRQRVDSAAIIEQATELLADPVFTTPPVFPTNYTTLIVNDTFSGALTGTKLQFPLYSNEWQEVPFLQSDIDAYTRIAKFVPELTVDEFGIPLLNADLVLSYKLETPALTVPAVYFTNYPTSPQTEPFNRAFYDSQIVGFPVITGTASVDRSFAWPNQSVVSGSSVKKSDLLPLTNYTAYRATITKYTSALVLATTERGTLPGTGYLISSTDYNRIFYANSRVHFNLPLLAGKVELREVPSLDTQGTYALIGNNLRAMFVYHPTAVMAIQIYTTLTNIQLLYELELRLFIKNKAGEVVEYPDSAPFTLGVLKKLNTGFELVTRTATVRCPVFLLPLSSIPQSDCFSIHIEIYGVFRTMPPQPAYIQNTFSNIDCVIDIDGISY